jgi:hypothetical protein
MFASLDDVNVHLPTDKLQVNDAELDTLELDADRIIRGYMAGVFAPATIAAWADPDSTPELIRAIAGRLTAAFYYKARYSEDLTEIPAYAQQKYDEAMALIAGIRDGSIVMIDVTEVATVGQFTSDDFYPNNTDKGPMFSVDDHLLTLPPTGGR